MTTDPVPPFEPDPTPRCGECHQRLPRTYYRKRSPRAEMALRKLAVTTRAGQWRHALDFIGDHNVGGDFAKLRYWGLIEEWPGHRGWWRVTDYGRAFVAGRVHPPTYAAVRNGECLRLADVRPVVD